MATLKKGGHNRYEWHVEWWEGEKRHRKYFLKRKDAEGFLMVKRTEIAHLAPAEDPITAEERAAIMKARRAGLNLERMVAEAVRSGVHLRQKATLQEVIGWRLEEVAQARRRDRYQKGLAKFFEGLAGALGGEREVGGIFAEDLAPLIYTGGAAATGARRRAVLHSLFATAVKRRVIERNPVTDLAAVSSETDGEVEILTVEEAQRLWAVCWEVAPALLPALGLGLWGGLRTAEIQGLQWKDVRRKTGIVYVGGRLAKTRQRRLVTIEGPLEAALEHRGGAVGSVWPANGRRLWDAVRRAAGWQARAVEGGGRAWPHNGIRHSFVSYHLAFFGDAARSALEAGHSQAVLFRHYRELVTAAEAASWWGRWTVEAG